MTRKKQINKTAEEFLNNQPQGYFKTKSERNTAHTGFVMGARWADEHPENPWISVKERLPEESGKHKGWLSDTVFVVTNKGDGTSARYDLTTKAWCPAKILQGHITHWMPIPELEE